MGTTSKNQKHNRGKGQKKRILDGQVVLPIRVGMRFMGGYILDKSTGHMDMVTDTTGNPVPFKQIGKLEYV